MKKKLFLHVGTHKTGTTALQSLLATNQKLLSDGGVLFPSAGRIGKYSGHHNIVRELNDQKCFRKKYGTLEKLCYEIKKSNHKIIILSSEDFGYLYGRSDKLRFFKDALEQCGCHIEVVLFFRDHASYAELLYRELLKDGLDISFQDFTQELIKTGMFIFDNNRRFCFMYENVIQGFTNIFGDANVHCETYAYPIEISFFDITGLSGLYKKIKPVKRGHLTNEPPTIIKSTALESYNRLATVKAILKSQKQIGRNQIISAQSILLESEHKIFYYTDSIVNKQFTMRFSSTIEYLRNHYQLELISPVKPFVPISEIYNDDKYRIAVNTLIDKAMRISLLNPVQAKILRKFYRSLYFIKNLINS